MTPAETRTAVVVMEAGAPWPSYSRELAGRASSAIVESQPTSEGIDEFAARVAERLRRLSDRAVDVPFAIIAVGHDSDSAAMAARYRMARAALSAMASVGDGELLICAPEHLSDSARHGLVAFAGALRDGLIGSDLNIRLRFCAEASKSGLRQRLARASAEPESERALA